MRKAALGHFLARNPFPNGLTDGLFYREKMRAIHRVAPNPDSPEIGVARILEVGGGRSGLARLLYPDSDCVTLDLDPALGPHLPSHPSSSFVCADAGRLPFDDAMFDMVTLFDVLEHIEDDATAAKEAKRVVKPGGHILTSAPHADWRYPHHPLLRPLCPEESELTTEWGHVRRGYTEGDLTRLFGAPPRSCATFINPLTAWYHDVAWSRLSRPLRLLCYAAMAPVATIGYLGHRPTTPGSESAMAWQF